MEALRTLVLERLMRYYRLLAEWTARAPLATATSAQIAEALDIHPTQVRKDFAAIGLLGTGRLGYDVCEVCRAIEAVLGFDQRYKAVLVGTGHLGGVLLAYSGFRRYGLHIVAAFDEQQRKRSIGGCPIRSMKAMKPFIRRHHIHLAILAPPTEVTRKLTDRLLSAGVQAIWNFTPVHLNGLCGVLVRNEQHFSIGLSEIAYHLKQGKPLDGQACRAMLPGGARDVPPRLPARTNEAAVPE